VKSNPSLRFFESSLCGVTIGFPFQTFNDLFGPLRSRLKHEFQIGFHFRTKSSLANGATVEAALSFSPPRVALNYDSSYF